MFAGSFLCDSASVKVCYWSALTRITYTGNWCLWNIAYSSDIIVPFLPFFMVFTTSHLCFQLFTLYS